jgi:hypothetical protein
VRTIEGHRTRTFVSTVNLVGGSLALLRARGRLVLIATLVLVTALAFGLSRASASQSHVFTGSFGSSGSGAGQFKLAGESGLVVDQSTGNVYVADTGNHRVGEFSESGGFILAFGWGVATGAAEPQVCTATCQAGLPGNGPGQFENPTFIAVDNTPGGVGGFYVADGTAANERQTVTINATKGTFSLTFEGQTTKPLAYNAPPSPGGKAELGSVQEALEALSNIGENNVHVSNATNSQAGGPYKIEFTLRLGLTNVPQITANSAGLEGGSATVETVVEGVGTTRVQKFGPSGNLITTWGGTPALGELDGTTCSLCGNFPHFGELRGVGVKPEGHLLVLENGHPGTSAQSVHLSEWGQSSGEFVGAPGTSGKGDPIGIALDPAGRLYLGVGVSHLPPFEVIQTSYIPGTEPSYHENFRIDPGPATGVAVDPATEDLYVAHYNTTDHHSDVAAYAPEGKPLESFGGGGEITEARSIAVSGSTSDVYVADRGAGRVEIFVPGGPRNALTVTRTGTALGSVASVPAGIACPSACSAAFPEGEVVALTATPPEHSTFLGWSGGGCSGPGVCQIALTAATTVTATFAQDRPVLSTAPASAITRHTATLTGTVNPEGDASSCSFEYGLTSAYGAQAPCGSHPGSGAASVSVSAQLWELAAGMTYHYRLMSANTGGATYGPDMTFTTLAESCAVNAALCPAQPGVSPLATVAVVSPKPPVPTTTKTLTNAQKLARALKACRKQRKKRVRLSCEKQARNRYAPAKKKAKKSTLSKRRG